MDFRKQFAKPTGTFGWLVGHLMAWKNRERSEYVFSLMELQPKDRVLEIGFGSGSDIRRASREVAFVAGVDHSDVMVRQASKKNAEMIGEGRVELQLGSAERLPYPDAHFDKVYAINVGQFWKDPVATLTEIARVVKPGGVTVVAIQPRQKGATEDSVHAVGRSMAARCKRRGSAKFARIPGHASGIDSVRVSLALT
jgi:ubiquinone/menaquinone biosynthesis C-methylase UbiE